MEYISSDTNVWLDFAAIGRLELPFMLRYIYLMYTEMVDSEILNPPGLGERLVTLGLRKTELSTEEFFLADAFGGRYAKLSTYDCVALAIAKARGLPLLTGDGALRKAAKAETVNVIGTLGILDRLLGENIIGRAEYERCIRKLQAQNGGKVRLPSEELEKRLKE